MNFHSSLVLFVKLERISIMNPYLCILYISILCVYLYLQYIYIFIFILFINILFVCTCVSTNGELVVWVGGLDMWDPRK